MWESLCKTYLNENITRHLISCWNKDVLMLPYWDATHCNKGWTGSCLALCLTPLLPTLLSSCSNVHDRIVSVFDAVMFESLEIKAIQYCFSALMILCTFALILNVIYRFWPQSKLFWNVFQFKIGILFSRHNKIDQFQYLIF